MSGAGIEALCERESCNGDGNIAQPGPIRLMVAYGVAEPGAVVSSGEIGPIVGPAAFFPSEGAHDDGVRDVE